VLNIVKLQKSNKILRDILPAARVARSRASLRQKTGNDWPQFY